MHQSGFSAAQWQRYGDHAAEAHSDGSFSVISHGDRFGEPGFYFTVHSSRGVRARYLKSLRESIRVYPGEANTVRADHMLSIWGARFLRLHYRLIKRKVLEASN